MRYKLLLVSFLFFFYGHSQITVNNTDVDDAVNDFFVGNGVFISNITFNNLPFDTTFSQVGYFSAGTSGFPFDMGIIMGTGNVMAAQGPNTSGSFTNNTGVSPDPNDPDLLTIANFPVVNNEAVLEFDFIPAGDSVVFEYIFASEEYHEYVSSGYNDVFAFFISGPGISGPYTNMAENIAIVPGTSLPVTIDNINNGSSNSGPCTNCAYFVNNIGGTAVQYDAYTTVLSATSAVVCGEVYHLKLAIADIGDNSYDSGIFLKGSSFISNGIGLSIGSDQAFSFSNTTLLEGCDSLGLFLSLPEWAVGTSPEILVTTGGSAIKDIDYSISDTTIVFAPGDTLLPFFIQAYNDGIAETGDSILLTINFLTPCGDTLGVDKVIYLSDATAPSVTISDTTVSCPGTSVLIEPVIVGAGTFSFTTWNTGDTSSTLNLTVYSDTTIIVQVNGGCGVLLTDTAFIDLLSDLGGIVTVPWLCYNDSVVAAYFSGTADSISWSNDTLVVPFTGIYFYDLEIYDTIYGCVDSLTYQVFQYPTPFQPNVYTVADTLLSDNGFVTYQWYYNGNAIPGADSVTHVPADTGYYYVEAWDTNGCSAISDSTYVSSSLGIGENAQQQFVVYPNPSNGSVTLEFPLQHENSSVIIHNLAGQVLFRQNTSGLTILQVDLVDFPGGSYIIRFIGDDGQIQTRNLVIK